MRNAKCGVAEGATTHGVRFICSAQDALARLAGSTCGQNSIIFASPSVMANAPGGTRQGKAPGAVTATVSIRRSFSRCQMTVYRPGAEALRRCSWIASLSSGRTGSVCRCGQVHTTPVVDEERCRGRARARRGGAEREGSGCPDRLIEGAGSVRSDREHLGRRLRERGIRRGAAAGRALQG
jgi:hypothetical protein